jgi:hypothetical protein
MAAFDELHELEGINGAALKGEPPIK